MRLLLRFLLIPLSIAGMISILFYSKGMFYEDSYPQFEGKGTSEEPYLIQDKDDLKTLRDLVNAGESFEDIYFLQSEDIDLEGEEWIPIGIYGSGKYFAGIYDGGTHCIENLLVIREEESSSNVGFFGILNGTVKNFGIESGEIAGDYVGTITSHGTDRTLILNCYNKASVTGTGRAGGICDNIGNGSVINCVNYGLVSAPVAAQIVSYSAKNLMAVYPVEGAFTDYFTGIYIDMPISGNSPAEQLNAGIDMLLDSEVITGEETTKWQ